ncbi:hypothetical protein [Pseudorhizobium banfieldiae]|nr:hypothetical protein [Pseudorhizobium banfieldiae]
MQPDQVWHYDINGVGRFTPRGCNGAAGGSHKSGTSIDAVDIIAVT